jgi:galactokinase
MREFKAVAPGRVCLFGEHSDYLGLDVIPAAISLCIQIDAIPRDDDRVLVDYVDLGECDEFKIGKRVEYRHHRDYIRSAFNVFLKNGFTPQNGVNLRVRGNLPIAGGLSSSSALSVAAVLVVAYLSGVPLTKSQLARLAFQSEVVEFGESGGMQDHLASAYGGVIHLDLGNDYRVTEIPIELNSFVIGDSREEKSDTVGDIRYIKTTVEKEYEEIRKSIPSFDRRKTPLNKVYELNKSRSYPERQMAEATLRNRNLTQRAFSFLLSGNANPKEIGDMLKEHHEILKDGLHRSTERIERLITAAYDAGALGCKINGSGGGGTMMAYSDRNHQEIASAIEDAGGKAFIVRVGKGATLTTLD